MNRTESNEAPYDKEKTGRSFRFLQLKRMGEVESPRTSRQESEAGNPIQARQSAQGKMAKFHSSSLCQNRAYTTVEWNRKSKNAATRNQGAMKVPPHEYQEIFAKSTLRYPIQVQETLSIQHYRESSHSAFQRERLDRHHESSNAQHGGAHTADLSSRASRGGSRGGLGSSA